MQYEQEGPDAAVPLLCVLTSDGLMCAALSPFAANHWASCLPFLQGQGGLEPEVLGFCSIVLCFTPRFPGTVELCDALGIVLLCTKNSSWQGLGENTSTELKGIFFKTWGADT